MFLSPTHILQVVAASPLFRPEASAHPHKFIPALSALHDATTPDQPALLTLHGEEEGAYIAGLRVQNSAGGVLGAGPRDQDIMQAMGVVGTGSSWRGVVGHYTTFLSSTHAGSLALKGRLAQGGMPIGLWLRRSPVDTADTVLSWREGTVTDHGHLPEYLEVLERLGTPDGLERLDEIRGFFAPTSEEALACTATQHRILNKLIEQQKLPLDLALNILQRLPVNIEEWAPCEKDTLPRLISYLIDTNKERPETRAFLESLLYDSRSQFFSLVPNALRCRMEQAFLEFEGIESVVRLSTNNGARSFILTFWAIRHLMHQGREIRPFMDRLALVIDKFREVATLGIRDKVKRLRQLGLTETTYESDEARGVESELSGSIKRCFKGDIGFVAWVDSLATTIPLPQSIREFAEFLRRTRE